MECNNIGSFKKKRKFDNQEEAISVAKVINAQDHQIHKVVPYRCSVCGKFHIGKNKTILSEKDKIKFKNAINEK
jgi:hypothetical protein